MPPKKKKSDGNNNDDESMYEKLMEQIHKSFSDLRVSRGEKGKSVSGELDMIKGCAEILQKAIKEMTDKYFKGDEKAFMTKCAVSAAFCGEEIDIPGDDERSGMRAGVALVGSQKTVMLLLRHMMDEVPREMAKKTGDSEEECIMHILSKVLEGKAMIKGFKIGDGKAGRDRVADALESFMRKREENGKNDAISEVDLTDLKDTMKNLSFEDIKKFLD